MLQRTIREIHQRLRALETREYAEVVGPGSVINAQYLTLALHAVLTAERRFVDGDGLVGTDAGPNADYTLDIDLVAAWSGLEFVAGELRIDEDADFTWTGTHTFNANILLAGGVTIDGMDPSAFLVTYAAHDHSAGDPTQVDHADLVNVLANQHHNEDHILLSAPHTDTLADNVVDGDVIIGNITPAWSRLAIAIPAANVRNVLGIDNGELRPSWKTALDAVNPADIAGAAAPGTSLIFSHRDHVHNHPALGANLHHTQIHDVVGGDHTLTGAQWNLVGATALNTIGLLLASSNPGAAAAILMSTAAGDLTLHDLTATGQLNAGAGAAEGIILGADAQWYRSAANMLRTPDSVTIDVGINIGTSTGAVAGEGRFSTAVTIDLTGQDYKFLQGVNNTRLALESQSAAGALVFELSTQDHDGTDEVHIHIYGVGGRQDAVDTERLILGYEPGATPYWRFDSVAAGTGTVRNFAFLGGGVGIGTSSLVASAGATDLVVGTIAAASGITIYSPDDGVGGLFFGDVVEAGGNSRIGQVRYDHSTNLMIFRAVNDTAYFGDSTVYNSDNNAHWDTPSDETLKTIIGPVTNALVSLCSLNPIRFRFNERYHEIIPKGNLERARVGFTAQDFGNVFPQQISMIGKYKSMNTSGLEALIVAGMQELNGHRLVANAEREVIRAEIASAKEQIGIMQNRLAVLEQAARRTQWH